MKVYPFPKRQVQSMPSLFETVRRKLQRDRSLPLRVLAAKSIEYAWALGTAPFYLATANEVAKGVRTVGRPRIENFGFMSIGANSILRSTNVPVELCTSPEAKLLIGEDVLLNYGVSVGATGFVSIGDRTRIGPYVMILDTSFHDVHDRGKRPPPSPVIIEEDVWIGAKASIMPGVRVGRGSIVGTGAVVTRDVPPFAVVAGVPAKVIRFIDSEQLAAALKDDLSVNYHGDSVVSAKRKTA